MPIVCNTCGRHDRPLTLRGEVVICVDCETDPIPSVGYRVRMFTRNVVTMDTDREIWAIFDSGINCGSGMGFMAIPMMLATGAGLLFVRWRVRRRR